MTPNQIQFSHLKAAIYCRKSEESEERQVLSLPAQRDEAAKLLASFGIRQSVVYEEAKSAKTSGRRLKFNHMVKDIQRGRINALVCWKLDRLARNMIEGGHIIDLLQNKKIQAIITPGKVYYSNENALLMAVEFGAANQYSRDLSENVKRGQLKKARAGYPHGLTCIGYLNNKMGGKGERKWIVDELRFPIIKQMFAMFLSGNYTGGDVHYWAVTEAGLTTSPHKKSGNRLISRAAVYRMLCDPIYAGYFYLQGERHELAKELPRAITLQEHYQILSMMGGRSGRKRQEHDVTYSGYIQSPYNEFVGADVKLQLRCDCGHKFSYVNRTQCPRCDTTFSKMKRARYFRYVYYRNISRCKRKEGFTCVSDEYIDEWFIDYVTNNFLLSKELVAWCKEYFSEVSNTHINDERDVRESRNKRLSELELRKFRYREMLADDLFTKEEYAKDIDRINREIDELTKPISNDNHLRFLDSILDIGREIVNVFKNGDVSHKRALLSKLGSNFVWNEKKLRIVNLPAVQMLIDGLNKAKAKTDRFEPENTKANKDQTGVFDAVCPILRNTCDNVRTYLIAQQLIPQAKRTYLM